MPAPNPWQNNNKGGPNVPTGGHKHKGRPVWPWVIGAIGITMIVVFMLMDAFPETMENEDNRMSLTHSLLWLVLIGSSVVVHASQRPKKALRDAALWVLIGSVLFVGYSFRHEFGALKDRLVGELLPHQGLVRGDTITLVAAKSSHFIAEAQVDGVDIRFLVDTGASDVTLTPQDARRLGFNLEKLRFDKVYNTANGIVRGAPVRLGVVKIGPLEMENVRASVNSAPMSHSLLGMSFLERLGGYQVEGDRLTLRP